MPVTPPVNVGPEIPILPAPALSSSEAVNRRDSEASFSPFITQLKDLVAEALAPAVADIGSLLDELALGIRRNRRVTSLLFNQNAPVTDTAVLEVVPFPNATCDDPTSAPHDLPPLTSQVAITQLSAGQTLAYLNGYYPGLAIPDNVDERKELMLSAIGVRRAFA